MTARLPAAAPSLAWSDALALGHAAIDQTHIEFVELLGQAEQAEDAQLLARLEALLAHTVEHFGQEDRWMAATAFAPMNCHAMQHRVVLQTLEELLRRGREEGELALVREILPELGQWFSQHAQTMDAGLAAHLEQVGFDPVTGALSRPDSLAAEPRQGCGTAACKR